MKGMAPEELCSSSTIIFRWNFEDSQFHCYYPCQLLPEFCCPPKHPAEQWDVTLRCFNDMLQKKGSDYVGSSFAFLNGNLEDTEAQRFFTLHGKEILSLELVEIHEQDILFCCSSTPKRILIDILLEKVPLLQHLSLGGYNYHKHHNNNWELEEAEQVHLYPHDLPSLKTFSWHADLNYDDTSDRANPHGFDNSNIALEILQASPNLMMIKDFNFNLDFEILQQNSNLVHLHGIHFERLILDDSIQPSHLLTFLTILSPKILSLQLIHNPSTTNLDKQRKLFSAISQLSQICGSSIKELDLSQCTCCTDIQLPTMPQVTRLTIGSVDHHNYAVRRCFPSHTQNNNNNHCGMNLAQIFPNLQILDCRRLQCDEFSYWSMYYPKIELTCQLRYVTTVVISNHCSGQWMDKLREICPNFKKAIIHSGDLDEEVTKKKKTDFLKVLTKVFGVWTQLDSLEVKIEDWNGGGGEEDFCLDEAFTGMSGESCGKVRGSKDEAEWAEELDMRNRMGIFNLKRLRELEIVFGHPCLGKMAVLDRPTILSDVSALYGFCHMPGLHVSLVYDHSCQWAKEFGKKFESLSPYVSYRHRPEEEELT